MNPRADERVRSDVPRVVYCVHREVFGPVFGSMVTSVVRLLGEAGVPVHLLLSDSVGRWARQRPAMGASRGGRRQSAWTTNRCTRVGTWPSRFGGLPGDLLPLERAIEKAAAGSDRVVVHCRGRRAAEAALSVRERRKGIRVLFDMRGLEHAELDYTARLRGIRTGSQHRAAVRRVRDAEASAARRSDGVLCVSRRMAAFVRRRFSVARENVHVRWNPVDTARFAPRSDEGLNEDRGTWRGGEGPLVAYTGSLHPRQRPRELGVLLRMLADLRPAARFLLLTQDLDRMTDLLARVGLSGRARLLRVSHDEVPSLLSGADVGVISTGLGEERCLANEVCAPVKYAEYLGCGIPVVLSAGLGDYSRHARRHGTGVVLATRSSAADARARLDGMLRRFEESPRDVRQACRNEAVRCFASAAYVRFLRELYARMHRVPPEPARALGRPPARPPDRGPSAGGRE